MMAFVRGVINRSTSAGSNVQVPGWTSAITGVAPAWITVLIEAANVRSGTITSSPSPTPNASSARWMATVPLLTANAWGISHRLANSASKRFTKAPCELIQPVFRHSVT